jgi:hypothetical protein
MRIRYTPPSYMRKIDRFKSFLAYHSLTYLNNLMFTNIASLLLVAPLLGGATDCSWPSPNGQEPNGTWVVQSTNDLLISWDGVNSHTGIVLYSPATMPAASLGHGELCLNGYVPGAGRGAIRSYDEELGQAAFPFTFAEIPIGYHVQIAYRDTDGDWNFSNRIQLFDTGVD